VARGGKKPKRASAPDPLLRISQGARCRISFCAFLRSAREAVDGAEKKEKLSSSAAPNDLFRTLTGKVFSFTSYPYPVDASATPKRAVTGKREKKEKKRGKRFRHHVRDTTHLSQQQHLLLGMRFSTNFLTNPFAASPLPGGKGGE